MSSPSPLGQRPERLGCGRLQLHPVVREDYRVGVPSGGFYREILNTDAQRYGGSNVGNQGGVWARHESHGGRPYHLSLRIPPLAVLFLKVPAAS